MTPPASGAPPHPPAFRGYRLAGRAALPYGRASGPFFIPPRAAFVPADVEDLAGLVAWASAEGQALVPRGGGTGMPGGNVGYGLAVDLASSFREIHLDPETRTVRAGAGVTGREVAEAAAAAGLFLPPLPSSADRCTLGGIVANNSAGARTFRYGAVRDWVAGLTVVLADGTVAELAPGLPTPQPLALLRARLLSAADTLLDVWPKVRKNSSGYALDRFLPSGDPTQLVVGSEGALALVVEARLRLEAVPAERAVTLLRVRAPEDLAEAIQEIGSAGASACELFGRRFLDLTDLGSRSDMEALARGASALLLVEMDGSRDRLEAGIQRIAETARRLGSPVRWARTADERERLWAVRHAASPAIAAAARSGRVSTQFIEDSVVPVPRLSDYLEGLGEILDGAGVDAAVFGHAGDANIHVNPLLEPHAPGARERVRWILGETVDLVARLGGTLSGEHGDGRVRAPFLARIWHPLAVQAFREAKEALDPRGVLNPGVVLPLPGQDPLEGLWADVVQARPVNPRSSSQVSSYIHPNQAS